MINLTASTQIESSVGAEKRQWAPTANFSYFCKTSWEGPTDLWLPVSTNVS